MEEGRTSPLTIDNFKIRCRHHEHHAVLFRLPPIGFASINNGEFVPVHEGQFISTVASVCIESFSFDCNGVNVNYVKTKLLGRSLSLGSTIAT